jgi:hypothetical protein
MARDAAKSAEATDCTLNPLEVPSRAQALNSWPEKQITYPKFEENMCKYSTSAV